MQVFKKLPWYQTQAFVTFSWPTMSSALSLPPDNGIAKLQGYLQVREYMSQSTYDMSST